MIKIKFLKLFFLLFIICLIISGCTSYNSQAKEVLIFKDGFKLRGYKNKDSTWADTVKYYDKSDRLLIKEFYRGGKLEGDVLEYYPFSIGTVSTTTRYSSGLKNGVTNYYDLSGRIVYSGYYYHDLSVGPVAYYDSLGNPQRFFFLSLDNKTLLHIDYANWHGAASIVNDCIYYTSNIQKEDSTEQMSLFLYLMHPPKFSFEYSILKKKIDSNQGFKNVLFIKNQNQPFIQLDLPTVPVDEQYTIGLSIHDSLLNKKSQVYINVE
jgi:hypothetical protein